MRLLTAFFANNETAKLPCYTCVCAVCTIIATSNQPMSNARMCDSVGGFYEHLIEELVEI